VYDFLQKVTSQPSLARYTSMTLNPGLGDACHYLIMIIVSAESKRNQHLSIIL